MLPRSTFSSDSHCRTQMHIARQGDVSPEMQRVAEREELPAELIRDEVARGRMIIPANVHHGALDPMAIGLKARVKINANIGNSPTTSSLDEEVSKLASAQRWGADTVMDLSTGKRIDETREAILDVAAGKVRAMDASAWGAPVSLRLVLIKALGVASQLGQTRSPSQPRQCSASSANRSAIVSPVRWTGPFSTCVCARSPPTCSVANQA